MTTASTPPHAPADHEPWQRPVRDFPGLVHLAPPVNYPDDPLTAVIETFSSDHSAGVVFVIDHDDRLLGCIREHTLDTDLVTLALPEGLWSSIREMDVRDIMRAARGPARRARDLMAPASAITPHTTLKDAVIKMGHSDEQVVGLVDEQYRLLGYVRLFEVLHHLIRHG